MNLLCFHFNLFKTEFFLKWKNGIIQYTILFSCFAYFFKLGKGKIAKPHHQEKNKIFYSLWNAISIEDLYVSNFKDANVLIFWA
jgi:hypothetical protein